MLTAQVIDIASLPSVETHRGFKPKSQTAQVIAFRAMLVEALHAAQPTADYFDALRRVLKLHSLAELRALAHCGRPLDELAAEVLAAG